MARMSDPVLEARRYYGWDVVVAILAVSLVIFLMTTMDIRTDEARLIEKCQDRLMTVSQAQQSYLVAKGQYADSLMDLVPYLDEDHRRMPFLCPITGHKLEMLVQSERYIVLAPYTGYSVNTGDASW